MVAKSLLVHLGKAVTQRKLKLKQHLKHLGIYIWQSWPSLLLMRTFNGVKLEKSLQFPLCKQL